MVLALMATVLGLVLTGVVALGGVLKTGPLANLPYVLGNITSELHELLAIGLLVLVILHVAGVYYESRRERENLALAMITGRKERRAGDVVAPKKLAHPLIAFGLTALLLAGATVGTLTLSQRAPANLPVPAEEFDPFFAQECSECHMLYHPSLLPASDWKKLMATLDNHFGEDASLDETATAHIRNWLVQNAAETTDTRPAHLFSVLSKSGELQSITKTRAWLELHDSPLESGAFDRKSVGSRANCQACHKDAKTGMFSPFRIEIPKE